MQTVLATFDDKQAAQEAIDQLIAQGFSRSSVHLQSGTPTASSAPGTTTGTGAGTSTGTTTGTSTGFMASVGNFFESLFDSDDKTHVGTYAEAVRRGSTVVAAGSAKTKPTPGLESRVPVSLKTKLEK